MRRQDVPNRWPPGGLLGKRLLDPPAMPWAAHRGGRVTRWWRDREPRR